MGEKGYYVVGFKDTAAAKAHLSCRCDRACTQPLIDLFLLGCLLSGWSAAFAQATFTESQRLTFDAVEAHCGRTRPIFDSLSPQQQAWSNTCWEFGNYVQLYSKHLRARSFLPAMVGQYRH